MYSRSIRPVVDRPVFDLGDCFVRFHRRRSNRHIAVSLSVNRPSAPSYLSQYDQQWISASLIRRRRSVFHLFAFFEGTQSNDAPAVFQDNRIRRYPAAQERSATPSKTVRIRKDKIMPRLSILNRGQQPARSALFPHAECDYTSCMRVWGVFFTLWCLQAPAVFPATERSPHVLYDAIKALRIDPSNVYRIAPAHHIQLRRGDAVLSFDEGTLAFFSRSMDRSPAPSFPGAVTFWRPSRSGRKTADGAFSRRSRPRSAILQRLSRFTDDTTGELLRQFRAANLAVQTDASVGAQWDSAITQLNPSYTLRILYDRLSPNPKPCFYAGLEGAATGPFDVVLDAQRDEQFPPRTSSQSQRQNFLRCLDLASRSGLSRSSGSLRALHYSIETTISSNNSLDATASVRLRAETGTERVLVFQLSGL